jgi:hypothetical protein
MSLKKLSKTFLAIGFAATSLIAVQALAQSPSAADCAARADRAERGAGSTMGGAGRGALGGAVFGAIVGDSSKAATRGAVLGGVVGGARQSSSRNNTYKAVYDSCMAGN